MVILYYVLGVILLIYLPKAYRWVKFKNKYPILSEKLPEDILEIGDKVICKKKELIFLGIDRNHGDILYVFENDYSVTPVFYSKEVVYEIDTIYGCYGLKWKKIIN